MALPQSAYALSNVPLAGTSTTFGWRLLTTSTDSLAVGEVLFIGDIPLNPIYDTSIPGLRSMTAGELQAIATAAQNVLTQTSNDMATCKAYLANAIPTAAQTQAALNAHLRLTGIEP